MNIFIVSLNKSDGKTVISAGIAAVMQSLGYKAGVYKPIQTSAIDKRKYLLSPDLTFVKMLDKYITTHSTYMFKEKTIPAFAAKKENKIIDLQEIMKDYSILAEKTDILICEADLGLMTPISEDSFIYNIPLTLNLPVIFIVTPSNDSVNNYLSQIQLAKSLGINIAGTIINKFPVYSENEEIKAFPEIIEKYSDVKILGLIRNFREKSVQTNILINEIINGIDLQDVFQMKIPKLNI
ncbi:dethiobiotin synthase [bacterium]|nr:dethiobiotin synthase [bacterium]